MVESQFKVLFHLNRLLILAMMLATYSAGFNLSTWEGKVFFVGLGITHFVFLMGNEFLLKMAKKLKDAELQTIQHLSVLLPVAFMFYTAVCYGLTGSFFVLLMGIFGSLEAQLMEQAKLSSILAGVGLGMFLLGLPFHYPHPLALNTQHMFFVTLSIGAILYYYGKLVSKVVRSQHSELGKLQSMALTDALTGLTNRRQFNTRLQEEISRARRHDAPLSLALFDLDDFKHLNDFYGHQVGDRILRELGQLIRQNIRGSDLAARYGGEEFALILPETRELEAFDLLERIRLLVSETVFCMPENPLTMTISVGVAQLEPKHHTAFELVELADKALYEAKRLGKNQVIKASSLMPKMILSKKNAIPFFNGLT